MSKIFYIVDIRKKQKSNVLQNLEMESEVLSLTPYSSYLLESLHIPHINFHSLINEDDFRHKILNKYKEIEPIISNYSLFGYIFRKLSFIITYEVYISELQSFISKKKEKPYKVVYVSDTVKSEDAKKFTLSSLNTSGLYYIDNIDKNINIDNSEDSFFYILNKAKVLSNRLFHMNSLLNKLKFKFFNQKKINLRYDNIHYGVLLNSLSPKKLNIVNIDNTALYDKFCARVYNQCIQKETPSFISELYGEALESFRQLVKYKYPKSSIFLSPFEYISNDYDYKKNIIYSQNDLSRIFMQHGSYIYEHIFLKYNEIQLADVNFVFNEYTNKVFTKYGAKKSYNVGSVNFNYKIKESSTGQYDFLYITHCATYSWSATYIDGMDSHYNADANNIYKRHKAIIKLFGTQFKSKKICIKIQPGIFTGDMLYVPFLELSQNYSNISIEFSVPISKLIEKSKYIISDYFSSEFINRELHYKRDIILFKSAPLSLPEETLEDMQKMFLLVDTVEDLENTIKNIETLTTNRKRYDDIIEYYSSKKCDTKKVVTEILEKELNARI